TGTLSKYMLHSLFIHADNIIWNKCLDGSRKSASVHTADSPVTKSYITDCQSDGNTLILQIMSGIYILKIFERGISGRFYQFFKHFEISCFQRFHFLIDSLILFKQMHGTQNRTVPQNFPDLRQ